MRTAYRSSIGTAIVFVMLFSAATLALTSCESLDSGPEKTIDIFYSNDLRGELEPCGCPSINMGGFARRVSYLLVDEKIRPKDLVLSAGNIFADIDEDLSNMNFIWRRAEIIIDGMNKMGYQVANIGEFEYGLGINFFNVAREHAQFTFVSSNIRLKGHEELLADPYVIKTVKDIKIGILGVASQRPPRLKKEDSHHENFEIDDPFSAVKKYAEELKKNKKVDYVILLSQLGTRDDKNLLHKIPYVDLIIGGWDGIAYMEGPVVIADKLVTQAGFGGKHFGKLTLNFSSRGRYLTYQTEMIRILMELPEDPDFVKRIEEIEEIPPDIIHTLDQG